MEDITDADYPQAKRVCQDFEIKDLGEYHGFQVNIMVFMFKAIHYCQLRYLRNFRNTCLEIYEFDSVYFLNAQGLAWEAASKKYQGRIRSVTDIHILLMVEKNIRGRICHATH